MGFIRDQVFPDSDGPIVTALRAGLTAEWGNASVLTVASVLPATKTRRVVIVSDDGGTATGRVVRARQRINVWADTRADAKKLARDVLHIAQKSLPTGEIISGTSAFVTPVEVPDEVPYVVTVSGSPKSLFHYLTSFVAAVKASPPA